jgi:hypothetical protein
MGDMRDALRVLMESPEGNTGEDVRIILKWIFKKWNGRAWPGLVWFRIGTIGGLLSILAMNLRFA